MTIDIAAVKAFHGHMCPGLAIGIRVAEKAIEEMGERPGDEEVVAVVETDNCAVDAIQFITGCTFGKGNLVHQPYGKNAFRFIRRADQKAIRFVVKSDFGRALSEEEEALMKRVREGNGSAEDVAKSEAIQQARTETILTMPLDELMTMSTIEPKIPERARIYRSVKCDACGEHTMEVRLRLVNGKTYCPECFEAMMARSARFD